MTEGTLLNKKKILKGKLDKTKENNQEKKTHSVNQNKRKKKEQG